MPIAVRCPKCATSYRLSDELAGRAVRCKCGQSFAVKRPQTAEPANALLDLLEEEESRAADQADGAGQTAGSIVRVGTTPTRSSLEQEFMDRVRAAADQEIVKVFGTQAGRCSLLVDCQVFRQDVTGTQLKFKLSGELNGRAVQKSIAGIKQSVLATGVIQGLGGAVGMAIARGVTQKAGSSDGSRPSPQLEQCFQNCLADLRLYIAEQGPRRASSVMDWPRCAKWSAVGIGAVLSLPSAIAFHGQTLVPNWIVAMGVGAFAGATFGAAAYFIFLGFMPTSFFFDTPRGRWLMAKSGCSTVQKMRSGYFGLAIFAALWGLGLVAAPTLVKNLKQKPAVPAQQRFPARGHRQ